MEDILNKRILNEETIYIIATCFMLGAGSDYKNKFITFLKEQKNFYSLNLQENIDKSLIQNSKNLDINLMYIFVFVFVVFFIFTEIYYIFNIQLFTKNICEILKNVRNIYELK